MTDTTTVAIFLLILISYFLTLFIFSAFAGFLCPLSANTYGIEFLSFTISDYESKKVIFEVGRDNPAPLDVSVDFSSIGEDMYRKIKYDFSDDVLRLPFVETSLTFSVGQRELRSFRMIERHYFRDQLIKSFDFEFGFCIPGSVNTWDAVYSLPALSESLISEMIANPFDTKSDSFYFVDQKLIMHNKGNTSFPIDVFFNTSSNTPSLAHPLINPL